MAYSKAEQARFDEESARRAILKTLIYSDIFDFPLTKEELWKYLISRIKIDKSTFDKTLQNMKSKYISKIDNYFCIKGQEKIIEIRKNNLEVVQNKLKIAKRVVSYLENIPTILFIGISGGLAVDDVEQEDDIDLFIISKKQKLYTTRFLAWVILTILGLRRKKNDNNPKDKICVNFLIDETSLSFPKNKKDLYTAREIVQIKPLLDRQDIYYKFLNSNRWVNDFFPNTELGKINKSPYPMNKSNFFISLLEIIFNFLPLEFILRMLQIGYMKKPKDSKSVTKNVLAFHPNDYRVQVLKKMNLRMRELGLLTKI